MRGKRLTAADLADSLSRAAGVAAAQNRGGTAGAIDAAVDLIREHLIPRYEPVRDDMPDGWHWCEELEADAPPQLLRSYRPLKCNPEDSTFSVDTDSPRLWQRWTIGGWASVTGRVCPISERPA